MTALQFKGRVFVENFHLGVPYHELTPVRGKGPSKQVFAEHARKTDWASFAPAMRNKTLR